MVKRCRWSTILFACALLAGCNNWFPSVRFDPGNTGFVKGNTTLTAAKINAMTVRYTASIGTFDAFNTASAPTSPVVSGNQVLVAGPGSLLAFDPEGLDRCSGTPTVCAPRWSGDYGQPWETLFGPEVAGTTAYVVADDHDSAGRLFAFDVRGQIGCSGDPVVCQPLWTADVLSHTTPAVVDGKLYVVDIRGGVLKVFDAAGQQGCTGTPVVCPPLWTMAIPNGIWPNPGRPAVVNGSVYVTNRYGNLVVGDADGVQGCAGTPLVCQPTWTGAPSGTFVVDAPSVVVAEGRAFTVRSAATGGFQAELAAFDAAGVTNCAGAPKTCQPLWTTPVGAFVQTQRFYSLAVADGKVFAPNTTPKPDPLGGSVPRTDVYDVAGTGCAGSPMTCPTLFRVGGPITPTIVNGLVLQSGDGGVFASDANGVTNCRSGLCAPLASNNLKPLGGATGIAVTGDKVYAVTVATNGTATLVAAW